MNKLNARQKGLYEYLEKQGNKWTYQEDIAYDLHYWYLPRVGEDFHNSVSRSLMTKDIQTINESVEIQKIIISSPRGIKLASEAEFREYIKKQYHSVFKKLKRVRIKERKGLMNGQTQLVFSTERDIVEAFLREDDVS